MMIHLKCINTMDTLAGIILMLFLISCGSDHTAKSETEKKIASAQPSAPEKNEATRKFDLLENIFENNNWLMVNGKDSNYLYCSRLGKNYFKSYQYKITGGDSALTVVSEIKLSGDTITWELQQKSIPVYLSAIEPGKANWTDSNHLLYSFEKTDSNTILVTYPGRTAVKILKTITLSAFLVRSKYDYKHGTRLAFENIKQDK